MASGYIIGKFSIIEKRQWPPRWCSGEECARQYRRFDPWVRKIPWSRKWQPTLVFLPGKFHGQRRPVGCSPRGRKESDTTEHTYTHTQSLSHVGPFVTLWTVAHQAPLSMEFSRQEYQSGLPFPPLGELPDPEIEPASPSSCTWQVDSLPLSYLESPLIPFWDGKD